MKAELSLKSQRREIGGFAPTVRGRSVIGGLVTPLALGIAFAALILGLGSFSPAVATSDLKPQEILQLRFQDGWVTLHAEGVPLEKVLRVLANETGIGLELSGDLSDPVSTQINEPLREAVRALIGKRTAVLSFDAPGGDGEPSALRSLFLRGSGDDRAQRVVAPQARAAVIGEDDTDQTRIEQLRYLREAAAEDASRATEAFAAVLADETDVTLKRMALIGLAKSDDPQAVFPILDAIEDENALVRYQALRAVESQTGEGHKDVLVAALKDESPMVRRQSIKMLAKFLDEVIASEIAAIALDDSDPEVRKAAVLGLRSQPTDFVKRTLASALEDDDELVRQSARLALQAWR